jgi:Transglycosylase SLT domain
MPAMKPTFIKKLLWLVFYSLPVIAFAANLTEPRTEVVRPPNPQNISMPVNVIIYKSRRAQLTSVSHVLGGSAKLRSGVAAALAVKAFVEAQALKRGVDLRLAIWIVKHESQFNPRAKGDGEASRGLWQISKIYHPEVSDAVAFNAASSTEWSLGRIREGKAYEWSTYRFCRTLYKDCPF